MASDGFLPASVSSHVAARQSHHCHSLPYVRPPPSRKPPYAAAPPPRSRHIAASPAPAHSAELTAPPQMRPRSLRPRSTPQTRPPLPPCHALRRSHVPRCSAASQTKDAAAAAVVVVGCAAVAAGAVAAGAVAAGAVAA
eukprot:1507638-Prymnesium_polylepis.1